MIEFRINNEILDPLPGATTSLQSNSPFFSTDSIMGEYSLPIEFPWTERNLRLLGYPNELPVKKNRTRIADVDYSENGLHFYKGTLIVEFSQGHFNGQGRISGYFLMGTSNFWQAIKNKRLRDLTLGGDRVFPWTGFDRVNDGFWKHIHDTWTQDSDTSDYVFYPIVDEKWEGDDSSADFINKLDVVNGAIELHHVKNWNTLVAHPYYIYILKSIFSEAGYLLKGNFLDDPGFKKLTMPSLMAIFWCSYDPDHEAVNPFNEITINVAKQLPDVTVSDFLISLGNKFGFGYEFGRRNHECEIKMFRDLREQSRLTDYSDKMDPNYKISFPVNAEIVSLTQTFDGADEAVGSIDFNSVNYQGEVESRGLLPALSGSFDSADIGKAYLITQENIYVAWMGAEDGSGIGWQKIGDNIYDYVQDDDTIEIPTSITSCAMRKVIYIDSPQRTAWFPEIKQIGNWKAVVFHESTRRPTYGPRREFSSPGWAEILAQKGDAIRKLTGQNESFNGWNMRVLFYHGMQPGDGGDYPFASNHNFNYNGQQLGDWSLSYKVGSYGLVDQFWDFWIKVLEGNEQLEATLQPGLAQYLDMIWSDIVLIKNTPYLVKNRTVNSPYDGKVNITGYRIPAVAGGKPAPPAGECPACVAPDGLAAVVNANNSVTFSFNGIQGYSYRIQWSRFLSTALAGSKSLTNVQPDGSGKVSYTTDPLPQDGASYVWNVVHTNCGSTCDGEAASPQAAAFAVNTNVISVDWSLVQDGSYDIKATVTLSESIPIDFDLYGNLYFLFATIRTVKESWHVRVPAGQTTVTVVVYHSPTSIAYLSSCYRSFTPQSYRGAIVKINGTQCS